MGEFPYFFFKVRHSEAGTTDPFTSAVKGFSEGRVTLKRLNKLESHRSDPGGPNPGPNAWIRSGPIDRLDRAAVEQPLLLELADIEKRAIADGLVQIPDSDALS